MFIRPKEDWITIIIVGLAAFLIAAGVGHCAPAAGFDMERLVDTIIQAESGGDAHAIGDGGRARGLGQLHRSVWSKFAGENEPWSKAFDPKINRSVTSLRVFDITYRHSFTDPARVAWLYNCGEPCALSFSDWKKSQPNLTYKTLYEKSALEDSPKKGA